MKILDRYIIRELFMPFSVVALAFVVMMTGNNLYLLMGWITAKKVPWGVVFKFLVLKLPWVIKLSLPVSMLFATGLAVTRLGRDWEVVAMKIGGISLYRLLVPILLISLMVSGITFLISEYLEPPANHASQRILTEIILQQPMPEVLQNKFFTAGEGKYYFYVQRIDAKTNTLHNIMIYELKGDSFPRVIIAKEGRSKDYKWVLKKVTIYEFNSEGTLIAELHPEEFSVDLKEPIQNYISDQRTPEELSTRELRDQIKVFSRTGFDTQRLEVELNFKFSIPVACLIFALICVPLSLRFARAGSFMGLLIAIVLLFVYYCFMAWGRVLGLGGTISPALAAWGHNIVFGIIGVVMVVVEK